MQTHLTKKPTVLLVLDGWGIGDDYPGNAIKLANTPNMDRLWQEYPHTQLGASGESVGLNPGVDGNSETGHLNLGAGRVVYQSLKRVDKAIDDGSFFSNPAFLKAIKHVKKNQSNLHLIGLLSRGFVHSSLKHLYGLLDLAKANGIKNVYIHGFTDGRDTPPTDGVNAVVEVLEYCQKIGVGQLASLIGRLYGMDRDQLWPRIEKAYRLITAADGEKSSNWLDSVQKQYTAKITDEFLEPIVVLDSAGQAHPVGHHDAVVSFNFRVDRPKELAQAFAQPDFPHFPRQQVEDLCFVTMTNYDPSLDVQVAFDKLEITDNLGWVLAQAGLTQLRLTENEKQKMVTYYINGQVEGDYPNQENKIFPSKGVKSYAEAPEMSAPEIGAHLIEVLEAQKYDVIIANICNGDMVGHTGDLQAGIIACETVDKIVGELEQVILRVGGNLLITADHGNIEEMINKETGEVDTKHSTHPVPFIVVSQNFRGQPTLLPEGVLADVAPTLLGLVGVSPSSGMTGKDLLKSELS
jgi:2,3-bisphosphoglycerate-independent phosphoglycerate mutase